MIQLTRAGVVFVLEMALHETQCYEMYFLMKLMATMGWVRSAKRNVLQAPREKLSRDWRKSFYILLH